LYIATSVPWENSESYSDKKHWIENHFGKLFHKRIFATHSKNMLIGDYLIDDRKKNGAVEFNGELLRFGFDWENNNKPNEYPTWEAILEKLL
jgi:5'(3')-deoxyribonucleotidase